jgi:hypothetical protein
VCDVRIVPNKSPVEVSEAKEDLDVFIRLRLRPFLNYFNSCRVHYDTLRGNKIAKKLDELGVEGAFREFGI